jgi:hypothetical protein
MEILQIQLEHLQSSPLQNQLHRFHYKENVSDYSEDFSRFPRNSPAATFGSDQLTTQLGEFCLEKTQMTGCGFVLLGASHL